MKILLIRHGESEADILNVHEGRADFELTERGQRQAQKMAEYVQSHYQLDRIYASTLRRARQTAAHLEQETGVTAIEDEMLMEFNNGLLAGLSREEADEKYPQVMDLPVHQSVYEQESALEFRHRAEYVLSKILSENKPDATIAVITHGGMINQLYHAFLKLPIQSQTAFPTGDTGIHEWRVSGERRYVMQSNIQNHLED